MHSFFYFLIICFNVDFGCILPPELEGESPMSMILKSAAFSDSGMIPPKYTCDGEDISPPLSWDAVPKGTESFVLICDDPDAPVGTWVHWVIYNLPKETRYLAEAFTDKAELEDGTMQGINDFKRTGYGGPCPPGGTHRYFFKLYALDKKLDLKTGLTKNQLLKALQGHIISESVLMGKYKRMR